MQTRICGALLVLPLPPGVDVGPNAPSVVCTPNHYSITLKETSSAFTSNVLGVSSPLTSSSPLLLSYVTENGSSNVNVDSVPSESIVPVWKAPLGTLKTERDEVVRVLDANTVKMKKSGLVTFAAVKTPSGYNKNDLTFPECMTKSPSSKARKLLPAGSQVGVRFVNGGNDSKPRGALVVSQDGTLLVNAELVRAGFARPTARGREDADKLLPGLTAVLQRLQAEAKEREMGMYVHCHEGGVSALDDQFEPLDFTVETKYGDDGGKQVLVKRGGKEEKPINPGDVKGCSDFAYYEDALRWYEKFYPYYGDVAKLDRDGDGVPCPGLPHTADQGRYRMKVPATVGIE